MKTILIKRDSKDKVRVSIINYDKNSSGGYIISRETGQFGGKMIKQPDIPIDSGKVNRTVLEQTELEYNSKVQGYKDKGYKEISENEYKNAKDNNSLLIILPDSITDDNGFKKPQLCKDHNKVATSIFEKDWLASRKLDGTRCSMVWDSDLECIKTSSRGGKNYDFATQFIRSNPDLIGFFKLNPNIILDGELYCHGYNLQYLSGTCRIEDWSPKDNVKTDQLKRINKLQYWIYDIMDEDLTFEERLDFINSDIKPIENDKILVCEHEKVSGWGRIERLHNKYVADGYEGLVLRDPNKKYKCNSRDNRMVKVKVYQDAEFKILGYTEGALRDEDMTFTCETKLGKSFKVKPIGDRELKAQYVQDMKSLIGKMATVKFFAYSDDGIPLQPVLKAIRDYE